MKTDIKGIITISVMSGLALAVILNAGKVSTILGEISKTWMGLIRASSGTMDPKTRILPRVYKDRP